MRESFVAIFGLVVGFLAVMGGTFIRGWGAANPHLYESPAPTIIVLLITVVSLVALILWITSMGDLLDLLVGGSGPVQVAFMAVGSYILLCLLFGHFAAPESLDPYNWRTPWIILPLAGVINLLLVVAMAIKSAAEERDRQNALRGG